MEPARAFDKLRFALRYIRVRHATVNRTLHRALLTLEEADALGAFFRRDIIDVLCERGMIFAVRLPRLSAHVDSVIRALALASAAIDAFFGDNCGHV